MNTVHEEFKRWISGVNNEFFAFGPEVLAELAFEAGWRAALKAERRKPDPLSEALNSGDGVYRP